MRPGCEVASVQPKASAGRRLWADQVGHVLADLLDVLGDNPAGLGETVKWLAR
jgi:hypothetical protein